MKRTSKTIVSGIFWSFGERIAAQLVSLVVTIVLARILTPEEFGIVSVVTIFITIANVFVSSGFGIALIQKKNADDLDFSTILIFSFLSSLMLYVCLFFLAIPIASFYNSESLVIVIRVMSIKLVFASINTVQQAYVSKQMAFKKFFYSTIVGTVVSAFVGVFLAFKGFGVWALVFQYLINGFVDTLILTLTSGMRVKLRFSVNRLKELFPFGSKVLVSSVLSTTYSQLRGLLMSSKYSPSQLSYYNQGDKYSSIFVTNIETSINKVVFQSMSDAQDSLDEVKGLTRKSMRFTMFILCPIQIGIAVTSPIWVPLLLTNKWIPIIPHLMILCVIYLFNPLIEGHTRVIKTLGNGNALLAVTAIRYLIGIILLLLALFCFDNPLILTVVGVFTQLIAVTFCAYLSKKYIGYQIREQIYDIGPTFLVTCLMGGAVYLIGVFSLATIMTLIVQIAVGVLVYLSFSFCINRKPLSALFLFFRKIINRHS